MNSDNNKTTESGNRKVDIVNYLVGFNGYPHLQSLLTKMPRSDQEQFIYSCMEKYAATIATPPPADHIDLEAMAEKVGSDIIPYWDNMDDEVKSPLH